MRAIFSLQPFKEVEISATASEWRAFALAVKEQGASVPFAPVPNPAPYSDYARRLHVRHEPGKKVVITVTPTAELIVCGDPVLLENLSDSALNLANDFPKGSHVHIDFQGDDHYISNVSASVVLVLDDD